MEPKKHSDDCYFYYCEVKGYNSKNKKDILCPNVPPALRSFVYGPEVPALQPTEILEVASTNSADAGGDDDDDDEFQCHTECRSTTFTQSELNDIIRNLGLPKEEAELLGSRLQENNFFGNWNIYILV
jgi:hypothetical protein